MRTEWTDICDKYSARFSFNDYPENRNTGKYLVAVEAYNIKPDNYDLNISKEYKSVITWNQKWYDILKLQRINAYKINGFPRPDDHYWLKNYLNFESKTGVCLIARVRKDNGAGDITGTRMDCFERLEGIEKHVYGKIRWGGENYRGVIGSTEIDTIPSSLQKLERLNTYKFNICFENCYHELYSWDYVTEKIFDCFKAKTVPIYFGAYNIEQIIPKELYIDFRDYNYNYSKLSNDLRTFEKSRYIDMTEKAFEFVKNCRLGNIEDFKQLLDSVC